MNRDATAGSLRVGALLVVGWLGACGAGSSSSGPSVSGAPAEDARVAHARDDAHAGREADAALALRALVDDTTIDRDVRDAARLALVDVWLDYEERANDAACMPPPGARDVAIPPVLGARNAARSELRCLAASGRDVSAEQARIDRLVTREASACTERTELPMDGRVTSISTASADPCAGASQTVVGLSPLDARVGVPSPAMPDLAGALEGAAGVE